MIQMQLQFDNASYWVLDFERALPEEKGERTCIYLGAVEEDFNLQNHTMCCDVLLIESVLMHFYHWVY